MFIAIQSMVIQNPEIFKLLINSISRAYSLEMTNLKTLITVVRNNEAIIQSQSLHEVNLIAKSLIFSRASMKNIACLIKNNKNFY